VLLSNDALSGGDMLRGSLQFPFLIGHWELLLARSAVV
jgi:hypothetical protein